MLVGEYAERVIEHFKGGAATPDDWMMVARLVWSASENCDGEQIVILNHRIMSKDQFTEYYGRRASDNNESHGVTRALRKSGGVAWL